MHGIFWEFMGDFLGFFLMGVGWFWLFQNVGDILDAGMFLGDSECSECFR